MAKTRRTIGPLLAGRYQLLSPLGKGASGVTWRAKRVSDGRLVAIKERLVAGARSFHDLERLKREGSFLASLDHPHIPRLIEHFLDENGPRTGFYLVTELVRGRTLAEEMTGARSDVRKVLEDLASLLDVLAYLHTRAPAVVHGDLKPENIVRRASDGALFLVDFHAARDFPSSAPVGMTTAVGTPGFMAPEQLSGHAEPRTDIHAAACVAVALLTRRPLYTLVDDDFRLKWKSAVNVPKPVESLLGRMLEPSLSRRAKDAAALAREARMLARARPERRVPRGGIAVVAGMGAVLGGAILFKAWEAHRAPVGVERVISVALRNSPQLPMRAPDMRSKCEKDGHCKRLNQGDIADHVREACAQVKKEKVPAKAFTIMVTGESVTSVGSCFASYPDHDCAVRCDFNEFGSDGVDVIWKGNQLKKVLDDRYGRPTSSSPRVLLDGSIVPHWGWKDPGETHMNGIWTMSAEVTRDTPSSKTGRFVLEILAPC